MKRITLVLIILVLALLIPNIAVASSQSVQATIPTFPVTLNGLNFSNNDYARYPLLVFRGITYFPMTYFQSRLMNIQADWTAERGLVITKGNPETPKEFVYEMLVTDRNRNTQTATIVEGKVTVNGTVIDNKNETYPLLLFRGITYFPLTWRFAYDEFGWGYDFDKDAGLRIRADNFFFISNDDGSGYIDDNGRVVLNAQTYYIKGDLKIVLKTTSSMASSGPDDLNLSITKKDVEIRPDGWFGYYQRQRAPLFTITDGMIYTTYLNYAGDTNISKVRVSIETGQIYV